MKKYKTYGGFCCHPNIIRVERTKNYYFNEDERRNAIYFCEICGSIFILNNVPILYRETVNETLRDLIDNGVQE